MPDSSVAARTILRELRAAAAITAPRDWVVADRAPVRAGTRVLWGLTVRDGVTVVRDTTLPVFWLRDTTFVAVVCRGFAVLRAVSRWATVVRDVLFLDVV